MLFAVEYQEMLTVQDKHNYCVRKSTQLMRVVDELKVNQLCKVHTFLIEETNVMGSLKLISIQNQMDAPNESANIQLFPHQNIEET